MLLSLLTLYNHDNTVLAGLQVPEGCDITTLRPLLLAETAELEILYPQPAMFKIVFDAWVQSRLPQWERMWDALTEEYNPLYNYDRSERWTDTETRNTQSARTIDRDTTGTASGSNTVTTSGSNTDTEETVGFNSTAYTPKDKRTGSASSQSAGSVSSQSAGTEDVTDTTRDTGTNTNVREGYARGNIGVTTSAQMLAGELEIRAQDLYNIIIQEFIKRFCLMIY